MFEAISDVFSSKIRLSIIAALMSGEKDFTTLKKIITVTDGNLGKQLELLEAENFILYRRELIGKRNRTTYYISEHGRLKFREYVDFLENILSGIDKTDLD